MVTIFSALAEGTKLLKENDIDTPRLDSEVLMSFILCYDRLKLLTESKKPMDDEQYMQYMELIHKRIQGMPVAYLVGKKEFMSLCFSVAPGILIPRGDTELAAGKVIEECSKYEGKVRVADVGCGSGAIGISTARYAENAEVTLIDISDKAVEISKLNAHSNCLGDRVRVIKGDLLTPVLDEEFDIIVSNPPYIETGVIASLQREVKDFEPILALDGGEDGLLFYRAITSQALSCLKDSGIIVYEIGYNQSEGVKNILIENGFNQIKVFKDLGENDRCIRAKR